MYFILHLLSTFWKLVSWQTRWVLTYCFSAWVPRSLCEQVKVKSGSVSCSVVSDFVTPYCSPPGFSVHGILQARILEWVAIPILLSTYYILYCLIIYLGPSWGLSGNESASNAKAEEMWIWFLGREDPLEKGTATHSSILAWEIPWTGEPRGLQATGSQKSRTRLSGWAHTHALLYQSVSLLGVMLEPLPCSKLDQGQDSHLRISPHCHPGQSFPRISS